MRESFIYDSLFDAWRSTITGHRVANGDWTTPVTSTRKLAMHKPWLAPMEIIHRWIARQANPDRKSLDDVL